MTWRSVGSQPSTPLPSSFREKTSLKHDLAQKTAVKSNEVTSHQAPFRELARGEVKIVWVKNQIPSSESSSKEYVYYTPVSAVLEGPERELKKEVKKMGVIKNTLEQQGVYPKHLALEAQIITGSDRVQGKYTIQTEKASTDFEKSLRKTKPKKETEEKVETIMEERVSETPMEERLLFGEETTMEERILFGDEGVAKTPMEERVSETIMEERVLETTMEERVLFGSHLLDGLKDLHQAGYVHGDMKPENCLIYQKGDTKVLKMSDYGKAKPMDNQASESYSGNTRFAPPEGRLSQASDTYGAAMILIRSFEEPCLDKTTDSLIPIDPQDKDMVASTKLRGIEKYVVESKACLATNPSSDISLVEKINRRRKMGKLSPAEKQAHTDAVEKYIEKLCQNLSNKLSGDQPRRLESLLKRMVATDPAKRISSKDALTEYQSIFGLAEHS